MNKKPKHLSYAKWGYLFILPFFIAFFIFSFIPLLDTVRYSFFEYYRSGIKEVGPNFVGLANYKSLLDSDMLKYAGNTLILWLIGFIPQIVIALLLANWFTDMRLKLRGKQFFKVVIYLPNLIMASAFAMLFFALFSTNGPINSILMSMGLTKTPIDFMGTAFGTRSLIGLMNFLMWFGNTTIMLMAAIMGVDPTLYEAAELDGAGPVKRFFKITLPYISPTIQFLVVMGLISSFQYFTQAYVFASVSQVGQSITGGPQNSLLFYSMYLYMNGFSYMKMGYASAMAIVLFLIVLVVSFVAMYLMEKRVTYDVE